jgi:carbamoyl-phosphate synthase large subunit
MDEARQAGEEIGFPLIIRPSFTLGGTGGGVVYNREDLESMARGGLDASLIHTIMLEESVLGWKEFELEVMRDHMDNVVIICSIENFDPMGMWSSSVPSKISIQWASTPVTVLRWRLLRRSQT